MSLENNPDSNSEQNQPVTIELDWKTARILENIQQAVDRIQLAVGDDWTGGSGASAGTAIDTDALSASIGRAVSDALQVAMADFRLSVSTAIRDSLSDLATPSMETPAIAPTDSTSDTIEAPRPLVTDTEKIRLGLKQTSRDIRWNHTVLTSETPPTEAMLDKAGAQGYELVHIIYDGTNDEWVTYMKKLVIT